MDPRFACTACGKCCHGWLPLTLKDAIGHSGRLPLAMVWPPVRPNARLHGLAVCIGAELSFPKRRTVAVQIVPTVYLPPSFAYPELRADSLCGIHEIKPSRCRTMPLYPYREEVEQADLLVLRAGWECDISAAAPVAYGNHAIVDRRDFDAERNDLIEQAPVIRSYADYARKYMPWAMAEREKQSGRPSGGQLVTGLSSFLTAARLPRLPPWRQLRGRSWPRCRIGRAPILRWPSITGTRRGGRGRWTPSPGGRRRSSLGPDGGVGIRGAEG